MNPIFERIYNWNTKRNLLSGPFNKNNEANMLMEELAEFVVTKNEEEMVDALADIIVVAVGSMLKLGYDPNEAMNQCLLHIESRVGAIAPSGKWVKDTSTEAMSKLVPPNYRICRLD